jgi:hypothetical protein
MAKEKSESEHTIYTTLPQRVNVHDPNGTPHELVVRWHWKKVGHGHTWQPTLAFVKVVGGEIIEVGR